MNNLSVPIVGYIETALSVCVVWHRCQLLVVGSASSLASHLSLSLFQLSTVFLILQLRANLFLTTSRFVILTIVRSYCCHLDFNSHLAHSSTSIFCNKLSFTACHFLNLILAIMLSSQSTKQADNSLKRSFAQVAISDSLIHHNPSSRPGNTCKSHHRTPSQTSRSASSSSVLVRRHQRPHLRSSSMPVQTSPPSVPVSFPSFMSVFGGNTGLQNDNDEQAINNYTFNRRPILKTGLSNTSESHFHAGISHQHYDSISSADSTESSPTTTISTFDSSSVTDTSPSSSPESPSCGLPSTSFNAMARHDAKLAEKSRERTQESFAQNSRHFASFLDVSSQPSSARADSPGRKERNMKNLSVSVVPTEKPRPTTASAVESSHPFSAPTSPLTGAMRSSRRKPTNLTIRTPGFDKLSFGPSIANMSSLVPPTPGLKPPLRHFESSPALASPGLAPMGFGHFRESSFQSMNSTSACSSDFDSPARRSSHTSEGLHEVREEEENFSVPKSQEAPERGYPDGPICIYDSGLYLYLEPTKEEASKFDVVVNVASEVKNPFDKQPDRSSTVMSVWRNGLEPRRHSIAEPQSAASITSFKSAFERLPEQQASVTISPATPTVETHEPEYIHVPWDHASEILADLPTICKLIDERIEQGKRVLIHCQLGVSRSASLVIAYGLYKNRDLDFNGMYNKVKERSRWVGPNMSLIYQLTDFRSMLEKNEVPSKPVPKSWFKNGPCCAPEEAPAPEFKLPGVPASRSRSRSKGPKAIESTPVDVKSKQSVSPAPPKIRKSSVSPRPLPLREQYPTRLAEIPPLAERKSKDEKRISHQSVEMDLVMHDVPATPSLFSPRAVEFLTNPFSRTLAGDLAHQREPSPTDPPPVAKDPRSPHQRGQLPFIRSLNEFLWPRSFKKSKRV